MFKVVCSKHDDDDKYDSPFFLPDTFVHLARKKFYTRKYLDYELYHMNELKMKNPDVLKKYFCEIYRAYTTRSEPIPIGIDSDNNDNIRIPPPPPPPPTTYYYIEMELLTKPKWRLLSSFIGKERSDRNLILGSVFKALINMLLDLHFECDRFTYYDINPCNIFVNCDTTGTEIKLIDYGGLFWDSSVLGGADLFFLANLYFAPPKPDNYSLSDDNLENLIDIVVRDKKMLPVFYSIVCTVNMCLYICELYNQNTMEGGRNMITRVLKNMGKKYDTEEREKLYSDPLYQAEFINYLRHNQQELSLLNA